MQSMKIIVSDDEESQNSALKCNSDHAEQNRPDKALYAKVNTNVDENGVQTKDEVTMTSDALVPATKRKFREEIAGLRGLDALCIACGHIWTAAATGGVGMFYCLSGILVIASMHRNALTYDADMMLIRWPFLCAP